MFKYENREKLKREKTREAIALALEGRWEEAVKVNQLIIEEFSEDVEAYNRLGKSLSEVGRYSEAAEAFRRALAISPSNPIARKNLERLSKLKDVVPRPFATKKSTPQLFIEDSGKAIVTSLTDLAPQHVLVKVSSGDTAFLKVEGSNSIQLQNQQGEYLGRLDPRLTSRLVRLINGGNRYEVAVISVNGHGLCLIIREAYRHPSQSRIVSFPSHVTSDSKPYIRGTVIRYDLEDEEERVLEDFRAEWNDEEDAVPVLKRGFRKLADDVLDSDEEEREESVE